MSYDDFDYGVDLDTVEEHTGFTPIPRGQYPVRLKELTDERKGNNIMLKATFEVVGNQYAGRLIFENWNIIHPNQQTVNIARGQIKSWLKACGVQLVPHQKLTLNLMRSCLQREFLATVGIQVDKTGQYDDQNRINKYEPLTQQAQPQYQPPQQHYQAAPQAQPYQPAPQQQYTAQNPPPGFYYHAGLNQFFPIGQ